jgi:uncharacterized protein with PQ loop repeat
MDSLKHHHLIDRIAVITGVFSGLALYPQVYSVITTKSTAGLSFISFSIIFVNSAVWTFYGMHRKIFALIISSVLNMIAAAILIFYIL